MSADTFTQGEYLSAGERCQFICNRCGEVVEMRVSNKKRAYSIEPPRECPRCEFVRTTLEPTEAAPFFAWVEGVVAQALAKHNEDGEAHATRDDDGALDRHERRYHRD